MLRDLSLARGPAAAFVAAGLFWGAFAALVPALKPQAGLTDAGFGLAMLVATCGAVLAIWLAPLAERRLGARALPICAGAMAAAFLLPGFASDGAGFALALMAAAMTSGTLDVAMNARVSVLEGKSGRPLMNLCHGLFSAGYACAALAAGLAREAGLGPVPIFAAMGAVTVPLICRWPPHRSRIRRGTKPRRARGPPRLRCWSPAG
jgi:hypothetical protein